VRTFAFLSPDVDLGVGQLASYFDNPLLLHDPDLAPTLIPQSIIPQKRTEQLIVILKLNTAI
jgi:hypothetical protein